MLIIDLSKTPKYSRTKEEYLEKRALEYLELEEHELAELGKQGKQKREEAEMAEIKGIQRKNKVG